MSFPATINLNGSVSGSPSMAAIQAPSLQEIMNISTQATYGSSKSARPTINAPVTPFALGLDTILKVRFLAMRVRGGSLKVLLTTPAGTDQAFRVSDLLIIHAPNPGDEITAIKLVGIADVEYVLAGDVA